MRFPLRCRLSGGAVIAAGIATLGLVTALPAAGQTRYIAFGDSITFGVGDDQSRTEIGYPPRLEAILNGQGLNVIVENQGIPGETTAEAVSRIDAVLDGGGDVLLLMEGTNDINARVSKETIRFNLQTIARRASSAGLETVHATIIPRLPTANFDGSNRVTREVAGEVRNLAWSDRRRLIDPFETFIAQSSGFEPLYVGGSDKLHPNADGYDVMAQAFADFLLNNDNVPPVTGLVFPEDDQQNVSPSAEVEVELFDFGDGIDQTATQLLINNETVDAQVSGDGDRMVLLYQPSDPFVGVVFVGLRTQDLANPPNAFDGTVAQFVVQGTRFLTGDIDRDGRVDGLDLVNFGRRFGARRGDSRFRGFADFNGDDVIDGRDLAALAANFGESAF
ncbi:MAG: GDSL-type esterase/lipase family protein [Acidobacteriota bacterium]